MVQLKNKLATPEKVISLLKIPDLSGLSKNGEGVWIGALVKPTSVANAIYNAIGVRITDFPITPEKILKGLRSKKN
jgi:CO/xanthine dehydrogenase Mo-binding subunit